MRKIFLFWVLTLSACSTAPVYHRFWAGKKRADLTAEAFANNMNETFVPATLNAGKGHGLLTYFPVRIEGADPLLPDEVALFSYKTEADYLAVRASPAGQSYADSHWTYFDRETSSSRVPQDFHGEVQVGTAYDLIPHQSFPTGSEWTFLLHKRAVPAEEYRETVQARLKDAQLHDFDRGCRAHVVRVEADFWAEYLSCGVNPAGGLRVESGKLVTFKSRE